MPPGKIPGRIPDLKMPGSKKAGGSGAAKLRPSVPKLPTRDLFPQHSDKTPGEKGAVGKASEKLAPKPLRGLMKAGSKAKGALQSARQKGVGGALGDWGKSKVKGIGKLGKKGAKLAAKAAAKAAKHLAKTAIKACMATVWCPIAVAAALLLGLLVAVIIFAAGGGDEAELEGRAGDAERSAGEFDEAVEEGEVFAGHDYLEWSRVADLIGSDGRLVYGGELAPWVTDWWANGGRTRAQTGDARVLSETPCAQAAGNALGLRRMWEAAAEGRTALDSGFGVTDAEHYLFPRWSPELAEWLKVPTDAPPPASSSQSGTEAQEWETRRLTLCHTAAAVLGPLAALAGWETQMANGGTPSEAGAGVRSYQRMMRKSVPGYTDEGLRLLSLWLSSKSGWRHVYAEPVEPSADKPAGVSPCDLADQLVTWETEMDGRTAIFHPCPPKAPDPEICYDTQHLQTNPAHNPGSGNGGDHPHGGQHEAAPPQTNNAARIKMPACELENIVEACTTFLWPEGCNELIEALLDEIAEMRRAAKEAEQRLLDELELRNEAPPLLGGLLYQANLPRYQAILVVGAALEELGNDAVLFDDALDTQVARSLYALECPPERDNSERSYCAAGVPDTVEDLLARKGGGFLDAWHLGEPEGHWASKSWNAEAAVWMVTTANGDTVKRSPVQCPWVARWHLGDGLGRCALASEESVNLLAAFGYSSYSGGFAGGSSYGGGFAGGSSYGGGFAGGSCPEVSWDSRGIVLAGDGSSAGIKHDSDPRLGEVQSGGQVFLLHVCLVKPVSELLAWSGRDMDPPLMISSAWRSTSRQAELRVENSCGTGEADIHNPDAVCLIPTARPGFSMHNAGLAIDFANCPTRGTPCFNWLSRNMPSGLLVNLPVEPWHWSTNGQ